MRETLFVIIALSVVFLAACGGQKPAAAAKADTRSACCDSATLAKCRADTTGAGCGGCVTPAESTDSAAGKANPCPSGT